MPSTYTTNGGIELPANGEQSGTWGETVNDNMAIIDRLTNGVGAISLSGTTHTLTTADGTLSDGQYNVLVLGGSPSGTNTITISPNDGEHVYVVKNASGQTATFTQGSGANVSVLNNTTKIIYADGAGAGAAVVDITGALDLGSLIIAGTSVTATAAELNILDGVTATAAELNFVDGVTSNVQTQLNTKAPLASPSFTGTVVATSLDISGDIDVDGTTNLDVVDIDGAVDMASTLAVGGVVTANAGVVVDNFTLDGTTLALSSGDFTLDIAGDIILDADGGEIFFKDGGASTGKIRMDDGDLQIRSLISDKNITLEGNDGGSIFAALTLDMSEAGAATFNNNVTAYSDERLKENIVTIPDALAKVTAMRGVHYNRIDTGKSHTGVVAQEIQKIAPELVLTADDEIGTLSVDYGNITGYLIEAIKELKLEIETLKGN